MRLEETRNVLIGREQECARLEGLVDAARGGASGVLLVRGEPGIGKSALLEAAAGFAAGMTVLRARGLESESELAFAGLHELVGPALEALDEIPEPQAAALRGALRLAPVPEIDRFAVFAATLSLLAAVAERGPLFVGVDDAQWLDDASAEAIVFAARRLGAEGILLVATLRADVDSPFLRPGFPELVVPPLGVEAARELLGEGVSRRVADRLAAAAGGNPLALTELAAGLSADELAGKAPLSDPLPASPSIEQAFARRLSALSEGERASLLVAAASESEQLELIAPAAAALGGDASAFEAAEAAGLVLIDEGRVRFRHPLLRSVIYASAPPADRRAAHRALAEAFPDGHAHERIWHEAAATIVPDERIAATLEQTADDARSRSGYAAAARALERAARLSPVQEDRARRLLAAATSARRAGLSGADELLREAHELTTDSLLRFDIELMQAAAEVWSGSVVSAARQYVSSAERLDPPDPERTVRALSYGAACLGVAGELVTGLETARRAAALAAAAQVDEGTRRLAVETFGSLLVEHGATFEGRAFVLEAAAWHEREQVADTPFVSLALIWLEEYDLARRLIEPLAAASRRASDLRTLAAALELLAELEFRTGAWSTATTAAAESARLAEETGQTTQLAYSLAVLATVEAARGDDACRGHAARAVELGRRSGLDGIVAHTDYALGLLELGLGEPEAALAALESAAAHAERTQQGEPGVVMWGPELCEAYVLARREPAALAAAEAFERQASSTGRVWARAAALRCRGLLAGDDELDGLFLEALRVHGGTQAPFQLARTELAYGRRLRRARRRVDAREQLRRAVSTFERLGARPWAEAARRELAASGETLRTGAPAARDLLTPQELQIAQMVADGMTNREAATSLFLSPKTIESHLQNAYRKLGVHSRTQLAKRMSAGPTAAG